MVALSLSTSSRFALRSSLVTAISTTSLHGGSHMAYVCILGLSHGPDMCTGGGEISFAKISTFRLAARIADMEETVRVQAKYHKSGGARSSVVGKWRIR